MWSAAPALPVALGEVAAGVIDNTLYVVGEGDRTTQQSRVTLGYDLAARRWTSASQLPQRPFPGNHHASEVIDGRLYLFGGLGSNSGGTVQVFDPQGGWTTGASMPFAAGSSSSALIGGVVYVVGGIVGTSTTTQAAKYDPATDRWTAIAPMKQGRNHAAAATDGTKLYVFGGRGPGSGDGNTVANGFDTLQIYDPATNTWQSSADSGSTLAPLPQARGGMGRAVYASGEFYIFGGETKTGAGANSDGVYDRVDIYNPRTNTWRRGPDMPTARHGIAPVLVGTQILVAGGGTRAGYSISTTFEILTLAATTPPTVTATPPPTTQPSPTPPTVLPTTPPAATPTITPTRLPPERLTQRHWLPRAER